MVRSVILLAMSSIRNGARALSMYLLAQDVSKRQNNRGTHDRHVQSVRLSHHTPPAPSVMTNRIVPVDWSYRVPGARQPIRRDSPYGATAHTARILSRSCHPTGARGVAPHVLQAHSTPDRPATPNVSAQECSGKPPGTAPPAPCDIATVSKRRPLGQRWDRPTSAPRSCMPSCSLPPLSQQSDARLNHRVPGRDTPYTAWVPK